MKNTLRIYFTFFFLFSFFLGKAEAKWWIFGVPKEEITMNYLYLNRVSYGEMGPKVTLYRETLPDGMVLINGKASIRKGKIASVRVTFNNKETWEDARLSEDGTFEYRFRPELNKTYVVYIEVMETRGKTNDVEATRKEVTVSERNIMALIKETLHQMVDAYRREDSSRFMSFIAEDFAGDRTNLDRAIRKDFSLFDNIDLRFSINNVATGAKGMNFVSLTYSRMLVSTRTGQSFTDKGITEFVFKLRDPAPQVFSMKYPLIFGLSDAANVATGVVQSPSNEPTIVVDEKGNVYKMPFDQATRVALDEGSAVESGSFTLTTDYTRPPACIHQGFNFEEGVVKICGGGDIEMETNLLHFAPGVSRLDLGVKRIDSVREVPATGYTTNPFIVDTYIGHCFAFKLANGKYAVIEILSWTEVSPPPNLFIRAHFKYKYQPDGSRRF